MRAISIDTPHGAAVVHLHPVDQPRAALVLGHGAGGGIAARDLVAVSAAAHEAGLAVALVEQPYRVAGRRAPPRAPTLDAAWIAVVERVRDDEFAGLPLVVGGRSSGARVACRTTATTGAVAVLCLAFPLRPPRRAGAPEAPSRLSELDAVEVPVLVVQGARDRFGLPPDGPTRSVVVVPGDHALTTDLPAVAAAARAWLVGLRAL
ncbi:alpha/beta hydrolase family protein [Pengzhenrongella frigida]|uniref:Alpha/beta hydrolase n=1 Tax=Pengzhenrongella frigida TaxID=1259133 RepID=A0A4Q5N6V7_9MICO|nr:alpha/beta family hydrolase [Cellulomonas sp. HLT2-17]RYV52081.1 alpha/beta hydrolase [Cellulomonas sp. HLT2-17]